METGIYVPDSGIMIYIYCFAELGTFNEMPFDGHGMIIESYFRWILFDGCLFDGYCLMDDMDGTVGGSLTPSQ